MAKWIGRGRNRQLVPDDVADRADDVPAIPTRLVAPAELPEPADERVDTEQRDPGRGRGDPDRGRRGSEPPPD